jgi:hypothetical protein
MTTMGTIAHSFVAIATPATTPAMIGRHRPATSRVDTGGISTRALRVARMTRGSRSIVRSSRIAGPHTRYRHAATTPAGRLR